MTDDRHGLGAGFPEADLAAWRAAAKAALRLDERDEAGLEAALVRVTLDGVARGPLRTREDLGTRETGYEGRPLAADGAACPWDIRQRIDHPDARRANADALAALAGGATSLELTLDPTGERGVIVRALDELAQALDGVVLDAAPVSLDARDDPEAAAALLGAIWTAQDAPPSVRGALNFDPLGRLAVTGRATPALEAAADWALWAHEAAPGVTAFRADARVVHEAGGSEVWELAFAAATAAAYLETMVRRGLGVDAAARQIRLALALDADVHLGIVKIRALRRLWRRIAAAAGATGEALQGAVDAFSSDRMMTRRDPWTNFIRLTTAGFAGAAGGADSLTLAPFTRALGQATPFAQRLSRNIQILLAEEAGVGRAGDPARGAYMHETLTDALARRAWAGFQEIAAAGGPARFVAEGRLRRMADEARTARAAALAAGRDVLVGVTQYVASDLRQAEVETVDLAALRAAVEARAASRPRPAQPLAAGASPTELVALARTGVDAESLGRDQPDSSSLPENVLLRPIRLAEPFEDGEAAP